VPQAMLYGDAGSPPLLEAILLEKFVDACFSLHYTRSRSLPDWTQWFGYSPSLVGKPHNLALEWNPARQAVLSYTVEKLLLSDGIPGYAVNCISSRNGRKRRSREAGTSSGRLRSMGSILKKQPRRIALRLILGFI
jgi:hypothetical protein